MHSSAVWSLPDKQYSNAIIRVQYVQYQTRGTGTKKLGFGISWQISRLEETVLF